MTGQAMVVQADARRLPLANETVDLAICSPPFYGLRDYQTGHPGEIGTEADWRVWLDRLLDATREMVRVLKPTGSIFVDLGDAYSSKPQGPDRSSSTLEGRPNLRQQRGRRTGIPAKSLMLLPERYRIACVDQLGLTCRAVICWHKPNALPESVRDRVRRTHEDWVHLVKQPRYYAAVDEIREPPTEPWRSTGKIENRGTVRVDGGANNGFGLNGTTPRAYHPLGSLPGSVWTIPSEPLRLPPWIDTQHYAAYPVEWPRRLILGWSPPGICLVCGRGRVPVAQVAQVEDRKGRVQGRNGDSLAADHGPDGRSGERYRANVQVAGYACACTPYTDHPERRRPSVTTQGTGAKRNDQDAWECNGGRHHGDGWPERLPVREYHLDRWTPPPTRPAVVLDPFGGTGCTAHVAAALGRIGVSIDLHPGYCRIAADRTLAAQRAAKVLGRRNRELQGVLSL